MKMRRGYVDADGLQIHYREWGSGAPIVLIHQALRSSLEFKRAARWLAEKRRAVSVDLPGCGDSDLPSRQYFVEDHAEAVAAVIRGLGLGKTAICGHHTGGDVAMQVAAAHPELISELILSGPAYVIDEAERDMLVKKMSALVDPTPVSDGSHLLRIWKEGYISSFEVPRLPAGDLEMLTDFFMEQMRAGGRREELHVAAFSYHAAERLPLVTAPTLIIYGTTDMWACRRIDEMLKVQPRAKVHALPDAGEYPRLKAQEFATVILDFLDRAR